jgi:DNA-damage-inducible protein J
MSSITVRVDADTKSQAETLFNSLGISVSGAISMFLKQSIAEQALPFTPKRTRQGYIPLRERLTPADFNSDYIPTEFDTGESVGREVL